MSSVNLHFSDFSATTVMAPEEFSNLKLPPARKAIKSPETEYGKEGKEGRQDMATDDETGEKEREVRGARWKTFNSLQGVPSGRGPGLG